MASRRTVSVGRVKIGGGNPVIVQSMTKTDTSDTGRTAAQINRLESAGCEIARSAVPDMNAAKAFGRIKKRVRIPLVADIHFNYRLALEAIDRGADKIRINPGNISSEQRLREVVLSAGRAGIPIRIGINSGSIRKVKGIRQSAPLAERMAETAAHYVKLFGCWGFEDVVISVKTTGVRSTADACRILAGKTDNPLHVGITEAGPPGSGTVKSALGIGMLLMEGIGDTIRVSLTAQPEEEVRTAWQILSAAGVRSRGLDIISCPTCSRCRPGFMKIAGEFEKKASGVFRDGGPRGLKVAIMGCEVNGPGEAKHADVGIAGGRKSGLLFRKGRVVRKVRPDRWVGSLISEIKKIQGKT